MDDTKVWWQSKTIWANVLAIAGIAYQGITGNELPILAPEGQAALLGVLNIFFRSISSTGVTLRK